MTDDEKLVIMRCRWPEMANQEAEAERRLRRVVFSGDPAQIRFGAQALADWIDARCAMVVYFDMLPCEHDYRSGDGRAICERCGHDAGPIDFTGFGVIDGIGRWTP